MRKQEQETENYFYIKTFYKLTVNLFFDNAKKLLFISELLYSSFILKVTEMLFGRHSAQAVTFKDLLKSVIFIWMDGSSTEQHRPGAQQVQPLAQQPPEEQPWVPEGQQAMSYPWHTG